MKKKISLFLALVMLLSLTACKTTKNEKGKGDGQITEVSWYLPIEEPDGADAVIEKVNAITEKEIGVKVDMRYISTGDYTQKISLMMSSAEKFDLMFAGWANPYVDGARLGGFLDITKMLKDYPKLKDSMPDYMWDASKVDGKIYAVPNYQAVGLRFAAYLRKDLVDKYKFDYKSCKTLKDLEPFYDMVLKNDPDIYPYYPYSGADPFLDDPYQYEATSVANVYYDTHAEKLVFKPLAEDYINAEKKLREWFEKGYIRSDIATGTTSTDVKNKKYASTVVGGDRPGNREGKELDWGPLYTVPLTEDYHMNAISAYNTMTAVSSTSEHPDKALELLELVNTNSEVMNLLSFGIEGVNYEKVGDNKIKRIAKSGYDTTSAWMFGNMFISYNLETEADDMWEQQKKINDEAIKDKYLAFKADVTPISATLANIGSISSEYSGFNNGSININELLEQARTRYNEAGVQDIVDETARQIKEFEGKKDK